jgi:hypothetical protein
MKEASDLIVQMSVCLMTIGIPPKICSVRFQNFGVHWTMENRTETYLKQSGINAPVYPIRHLLSAKPLDSNWIYFLIIGWISRNIYWLVFVDHKKNASEWGKDLHLFGK